MTIIFLLLGLLLVGFAYSANRVVGSLLLIVIVLGIWFQAKRKGIL